MSAEKEKQSSKKNYFYFKRKNVDNIFIYLKTDQNNENFENRSVEIVWQMRKVNKVKQIINKYKKVK